MKIESEQNTVDLFETKIESEQNTVDLFSSFRNVRRMFGTYLKSYEILGIEKWLSIF